MRDEATSEEPETATWTIGDRGYIVWTERGSELVWIGKVGEPGLLKLRLETARELADVLPRAILHARGIRE